MPINLRLSYLYIQPNALNISLIRQQKKSTMSPSEIAFKIASARQAILNGHCCFGPELDSIVNELTLLKIGDASEVWPVILEVLAEIKPEHYSGAPSSLIHNQIALSPNNSVSFIWNSRKLKKKMEIEFVVNEGVFYYITLRRRTFLHRLFKTKSTAS